jgi:hypothetical protein
MSLIASASGGTFKPVPAGMHLARCYRIIDLGTQKTEYQGKVNFQRKVMLGFEVHGEDAQGEPLRAENGPMVISKTYTLSLNDKAALRADLVAWRGRDFTAEEARGFDLKNVLSAWCMITVATIERDGKEYSNITGLNPVPLQIKKAGLPEGENEILYWTIQEGSPEVMEKFSKNIQEKIKSSPEYDLRFGSKDSAQDYAKASGGSFKDLDDDIPF